MAEISTPFTVRDLKGLSRTGGDIFTSVLLIRRISERPTKNGNPFLSLELGDKTGSFTCNCFSDNPGFATLKALREGAVVRMEGKVEYYQERFSPRLVRIEEIAVAQIQDPALLANLVETPPEDPEALWTEFLSHVAAIDNPLLRATVEGVIEDLGPAFRTAPAAVAMHHAYRHGLLEHTCHVARAARALLPLYPEVDAGLALAGALLHDVGKVTEYQGDLVTSRTRRGILQGHVVLGYQLVRKAGLKARLDADRLERLEHIILSHQGELEWGAAVIAATPEAVFVAHIDNLDAKMGMVQRLLRQSVDGVEFSDRHPGLNSQLLLTKPAAPVPATLSSSGTPASSA